MSEKLIKLNSIQGSGIGAGNYVSVYNSDSDTNVVVSSIIVCNSGGTVIPFSLWQIDDADWTGDWNSGSVAEPASANKGRIFFNNNIPSNTTFTTSLGIVLEPNQRLIFEGSTLLNIISWGVENK